MPGAGRVGDLGEISKDAHGCPSCPHKCVGPVITGSPDTFFNGLAATRVDDLGAHAACCGPGMFQNTKGSKNVKINGKGAHRKGDKEAHCGGTGKLKTASKDVIIN